MPPCVSHHVWMSPLRLHVRVRDGCSARMKKSDECVQQLVCQERYAKMAAGAKGASSPAALELKELEELWALGAPAIIFLHRSKWLVGVAPEVFSACHRDVRKSLPSAR